ncbi:MAG: DMT family transporter [bacterium]
MTRRARCIHKNSCGSAINILSDNPNLRAYLLLTITALCWGGNSAFAKLIVGEASPMLIVSLRWLGAVLLLLACARGAIARDRATLRRHIPALALMGALGFTAFNALFYVAAHTTTALNLGIIQGAIPVFVLLGTYFLFNAAVSSLQICGVVAAIIGVCIAASSGDLQRIASLSINQGDYLMIIACLLYAAYALALRRFRGVSAMSLFAAVAAVALITSLPLTYAEFALGNLQWPTAKGWTIIALITIFPSFLAQIFFIQGVADLGAGRAGIFVNLVPVFAAILAVSVLREPFQWHHGASLALVVSGIWLSERKQKNDVMR